MDRKNYEVLTRFACTSVYGRGKAGASVLVDDTNETNGVAVALSASIRVIATFDCDIFRSKLLENGISAEKADRYVQNVSFSDDTYGDTTE